MSVVARFANSSATMLFADFMSVLSVYRTQQPDAIWFHCNSLPDNSDFYWGQLWMSVPLTVIYHDQQSGRHDLQRGFKSLQDSAVVATLLEHGGIYVDWHILVVRNLNPLRNYSTCFCKVGLLLFFTNLCMISQILHVIMKIHTLFPDNCSVLFQNNYCPCNNRNHSYIISGCKQYHLCVCVMEYFMTGIPQISGLIGKNMFWFLVLAVYCFIHFFFLTV